jgi:hypothetical protein
VDVIDAVDASRTVAAVEAIDAVGLIDAVELSQALGCQPIRNSSGRLSET